LLTHRQGVASLSTITLSRGLLTHRQGVASLSTITLSRGLLWLAYLLKPYTDIQSTGIWASKKNVCYVFGMQFYNCALILI